MGLESINKGTSLKVTIRMRSLPGGAVAGLVSQLDANGGAEGDQHDNGRLKSLLFPHRASGRIKRGASLCGSTNSFAGAAVINDPICDKIDMNREIGAMGPFPTRKSVAWRFSREGNR